MERRLAAVLAADMAGYSRLMEHDEAGVIERQKAYRRELIDPEIARHRGHIVKTTGDGMPAEFASAYHAVRCALEIQAAMPTRGRERTEDDRIRYRVGINVGDVVFDDGDIFDDCVNVAARLEGLAEPGGVCVSNSVYQMVRERLTEPFRNLGAQRVKNTGRLSARLRAIADGLMLWDGMRVLEIGGGPGALAREMARRIGGGHVLAIDRSARAIEQARVASSAEIAAGPRRSRSSAGPPRAPRGPVTPVRAGDEPVHPRVRPPYQDETNEGYEP